MIEDTVINLQIWDTAGQEDYKKLRPLAYPQTDIFVILFSLVRPPTLENVENIYVPEIKEHCPDIPYILVGVDSKLRDDFPHHSDEFKANGWELIKTEKGLEMKKKIGASDYIECDVLTQFHLKEVFETAANVALHPQKSSEDGLKKKDGKFHLFKNRKDKKSSKKEKESTNKNLDKQEDDNKTKEIAHLDISSANSHEVKQQRILLEVCSLNSTDFNKKEEEENQKKEGNSNIFIGEDDEKFHVFVSTISKNDFSISHKIIDIKNHRMMCKKILIPEDRLFEHMQKAIKEFELLHSINHPCICKIYGINTSEVIQEDDEEITTIALFLEYIEFDLKDCLNNKMLTNTIKVQIIIEIIHALIYIHDHNMIYRDLKIENVRLDSNLNSKIVDLGFIKINEALYPESTNTQSSMMKGFGSAIFMAPEILNDEKYDNKVDVYSFGMILLFILEGKMPKYTLKDKMKRKDVPPPNPSSSISKFCIDLILRCLSFDPETRPSFIEILNEVRSNSYSLASNVDQSFVSLRDQ